MTLLFLCVAALEPILYMFLWKTITSIRVHLQNSLLQADLVPMADCVDKILVAYARDQVVVHIVLEVEPVEQSQTYRVARDNFRPEEMAVDVSTSRCSWKAGVAWEPQNLLMVVGIVEHYCMSTREQGQSRMMKRILGEEADVAGEMNEEAKAVEESRILIGRDYETVNWSISVHGLRNLTDLWA